MTPIFSSHYGFRSILTLDEVKEIDDSEPISIFSICKTHDIQNAFILEESFYGFLNAVKNAKNANIKMRLGIRFTCCDDINQKDKESLNTENKVAIWALNNDGIEELKVLYSKSYTDGFYYQNRIDYSLVNSALKGKNLLLTIPFYDSFIFNNIMQFERNIVPKFEKNKPIFFLENHNHVFDDTLNKQIKKYCEEMKYETEDVFSIFYYKKNHFKTFQTFKCMKNRTTIQKPELPFCHSDSFSFEDYVRNK